MNLKQTFFNAILILFFSSIISACGNDDSEPITESPLIGTWKWTINERLDCGQDNGSFDVYDCTEYCYEVEFKTSGAVTVTVQENGDTFSGDGTYELNNDDFTLCVVEPSDGQEYCYSGEITISGDKFELFIPKPTPDVCDVIRHFERK